jgi:CheY-like chemotaxis protein
MAAERILVVEDDPDVCESLVLVLADAGYELSAARDGEQALELLRASDAPDLFLLDVMMPRMDGLQLRAALASDPRLAAIPVVMLSASRAEEGLLTGGVHAWLRKPVTLAALLGAVRSALAGERRTHG